jgi:FkbM family methyltransferase
MVQHPVQATRKAIGRVRRALATVPEVAVIKPIGKTLRFEHKRLPFLNVEDLRAMFTGSYDITLCDFLRKNLREGDIMLDVGSNVGYIAAIAASCVGTSGQIHGFEPLPQCFERLVMLEGLNPKYDFRFNNVALGETEGMVPISFEPEGEARNASLVPGKICSNTIQVPVKRLDDYIFANIPSPERIKVVKIDVEGFELPVLRGMEQFFARTRYRPHLVCEIKPWDSGTIRWICSTENRFLCGGSRTWKPCCFRLGKAGREQSPFICQIVGFIISPMYSRGCGDAARYGAPCAAPHEVLQYVGRFRRDGFPARDDGGGTEDANFHRTNFNAVQ